MLSRPRCSFPKEALVGQVTACANHEAVVPLPSVLVFVRPLTQHGACAITVLCSIGTIVVSIPRFQLRRCLRQVHDVREARPRRKGPSCFGFLAGEPQGLACKHGARSAPLRCAHRWEGCPVPASGGEGSRAAAPVKATPCGLLHHGPLFASSPLCVIHGHRPQYPLALPRAWIRKVMALCRPQHRATSAHDQAAARQPGWVQHRTRAVGCPGAVPMPAPHPRGVASRVHLLPLPPITGYPYNRCRKSRFHCDVN